MKASTSACFLDGIFDEFILPKVYYLNLAELLVIHNTMSNYHVSKMTKGDGRLNAQVHRALQVTTLLKQKQKKLQSRCLTTVVGVKSAFTVAMEKSVTLIQFLRATIHTHPKTLSTSVANANYCDSIWECI